MLAGDPNLARARAPSGEYRAFFVPGGSVARGKAHSDETRAAVLAALLAGQSVTKVAEQFALNHKTVIEWRNAAGVGSTHVEPEKRAEIGGLVADLLRDVLTTLSVQAVAFRDEAWLRESDPAAAATNFGILADKAFRILSALEPGPDQPGGDESAAGGA